MIKKLVMTLRPSFSRPSRRIFRLVQSARSVLIL
jgi:hypothetical protein